MMYSISQSVRMKPYVVHVLLFLLFYYNPNESPENHRDRKNGPKKKRPTTKAFHCNQQ